MSAEQHFSSTGAFFSALRETAARGEKRDNVLDAKEYLRLQGIDWACEFDQAPIPDLSTVVVVNHFVRRLLERFSFPPSINSFLTTKDAMATIAITTLGMHTISSRDMTWLAQGDLSEKFLSLTLQDRETQQAAIDCYGLIPIGESQTLNAFHRIRNSLKDGIHLGIFPEARVGQQMGPYHDGFARILNQLTRSSVDFQVLPVGILFENGMFKARFGEVFNPQGTGHDIATESMYKIAELLPDNLRGAYCWGISPSSLDKGFGRRFPA